MTDVSKITATIDKVTSPIGAVSKMVADMPIGINIDLDRVARTSDIIKRGEISPSRAVTHGAETE